MRRQKTCACGEPAERGCNACSSCLAEERQQLHDDFETRFDVVTLNACSTLDELKDWLKEHVLHAPS